MGGSLKKKEKDCRLSIFMLNFALSCRVAAGREVHCVATAHVVTGQYKQETRSWSDWIERIAQL